MQLEGILAGLGNPGAEYARTRHNCGFMLVDALLAQMETCPWACPEKLSPPRQPRQPLELWRVRLNPPPAPPWLLLKPLTYMNLSGEAVAPVMDYYRVEGRLLLVAHDEMDLPLGRMRFKWGGGAAGHQGIVSLERSLGTREFYRLRLGIGRDASVEATRFVTSPFSPDELAVLREVLDAACAALRAFNQAGFEATRQVVNGFRAMQTR